MRGGALDALGPRCPVFARLMVLANAGPSGERARLTPTDDAPELIELAALELMRLDHATKGLSESNLHPMDAVRAQLPSDYLQLRDVRPGVVLTAGLAVARQKPPTARGTAFFAIEDGYSRAQVVISPELWEAHRQLLRDARALLVRGQTYVTGRNKVIRAFSLAELSLTERVRGYEYS